MGVRIVSDENVAALYCSTSGLAFGPIFVSHSEAEDFLSWLRNGRQDSEKAQELEARRLPQGGGEDARAWDIPSLVLLVAYFREDWDADGFDMSDPGDVHDAYAQLENEQ
jgi:hypothetical protein